MKALIKQTPAYQAEVWFEDSWPPWVGDGQRMAEWPLCYALCEDAVSDDPYDYVITERTIIEDGMAITAYTAEARA